MGSTKWFAFTLIASVGCGGTVIENTENGTGGTGASQQGPGASQPGSSGSVSGDGSCAEPPDCNWCEGKARQDERGCVVGYTCPNGAEACTTDPCAAPEECGSGLICLPDQLCWKGPTSCKAKTCEGADGSECSCYWSCNDDRVYRSECDVVPDGSVMCKCRIDGVAFPWMCVVEEGGTDSCGLGALCCGFPS